MKLDFTIEYLPQPQVIGGYLGLLLEPEADLDSVTLVGVDRAGLRIDGCYIASLTSAGNLYLYSSVSDLLNRDKFERVKTVPWPEMARTIGDGRLTLEPRWGVLPWRNTWLTLKPNPYLTNAVTVAMCDSMGCDVMDGFIFSITDNGDLVLHEGVNRSLVHTNDMGRIVIG